MKIGILTSFYSKNYGAVLQAYAMQTYLESIGHEVVMVNYINSNPQKYYLENTKKESVLKYVSRRFGNLKVKLLGDGLIHELVDKRNQLFESFVNNYLHVSEPIACAEELEVYDVQSEIDVYFCGSDQIWNPVVHGFDRVYFLNFNTKAKKVAYAPSIAVSDLSKNEIQRMISMIKELDVISVREKTAIETLSKVNQSLNVKLVVDPTFLIDREEWKRRFEKNTNKKNYILVYILNYNAKSNQYYKYIDAYARERDCDVIWLPYSSLPRSRKNAYIPRYDVAPDEFMQLLLSAECVFTNSFHATALSINTNKDFYVFLNKDNKTTNIQSRLECLLDEYQLLDRIIDDGKFSHRNWEHVNFSDVNKKLMTNRAESEKYIYEALQREY